MILTINFSLGFAHVLHNILCIRKLYVKIFFYNDDKVTSFVFHVRVQENKSIFDHKKLFFYEYILKEKKKNKQKDIYFTQKQEILIHPYMFECLLHLYVDLPSTHLSLMLTNKKRNTRRYQTAESKVAHPRKINILTTATRWALKNV